VRKFYIPEIVYYPDTGDSQCLPKTIKAFNQPPQPNLQPTPADPEKQTKQRWLNQSLILVPTDTKRERALWAIVLETSPANLLICTHKHCQHTPPKEVLFIPANITQQELDDILQHQEPQLIVFYSTTNKTYPAQIKLSQNITALVAPLTKAYEQQMFTQLINAQTPQQVINTIHKLQKAQTTQKPYEQTFLTIEQYLQSLTQQPTTL